jgi:transcription elongation factor S-II
MSGEASVSSHNCEEDVLRIKKKLEKMMKANDIDAGLSIDMLNTIKKLPIDLQILKSTGIGVVLNNLRRSCNSEELGTLAKNLLKNWKKLVANETQQSNTNGSSPNSNSNDSASKPPMSPPTQSAPASNGNATSGSATKLNFSNTIGTTNGNGKRPIEAVEGASVASQKLVESTKIKARFNPLKRIISYTETKDPVRLKCREMLAQALELTESIENGAELCDHLQVAARCEDVIFNEFKNVDMKYKNRIRSRVINLKDARNPKLRENVRLGIITPDKLATMVAEDMASDDLKNLRAKFTQEAIDDHQMARTQGAKTSQLTCGKCKKNNVAYSEMQTRSADEPMTTFAYCQECGHRWKFG